MGRLLSVVGAWSFRHRRIVIIAWLGVLVAVAAAAVALNGTTSDTFSVPGTQSQQALDLLTRRFPRAGGATARIVFAAPPGRTLTDPRYRSLVAPTLRLAERVPQSLHSAAAFKSTLTFAENRRIAFADLHFRVPVGQLTGTTRTALRRVAQPARRAGLTVAFSGGIFAAAAGTSDRAELIGLILALIVLLLGFGSIVTAILPVATALVGVAIGVLGVSAASALITLNSTAPILATMLGLAVGIDYALFIVSRHRQQLQDGLEVEQSVALAIETAGSAVVFAGTTVVIALLGMVVIGIPFLSAMGIAAAGTVVIAVLVAVTLVPALLGVVGERVSHGRRTGSSSRWARLVTRHPAVSAVVVVAALLATAIPALDLRLALPGDNTAPAGSQPRVSSDLLSRGFGPGFTASLLLVGNASDLADPRAALTQVARLVKHVPGAASVSRPVFNQSGEIAVVSVTPRSGPDSVQTQDLVGRIRGDAREAQRRFGIKGYVTGQTAVDLDTSAKIGAGLPAFIAVIVGLALLLLLIVFRSIAIPVTAVAGFLLTISATLGVATLIFQDGHLIQTFGTGVAGPVVSFIPVLVVAVLFGLGMDYEVFLVSRIREAHLRGARPTEAILDGSGASARVITCAALIMGGVFAAFLSSATVTIKSIALSLACGVLIDAFLVRMTLIPALLGLLGRAGWWLPPQLERHLPHLEIESDPESNRRSPSLDAASGRPPDQHERSTRMPNAPSTNASTAESPTRGRPIGEQMALAQGDLALLDSDVAQRLLESTIPARLAYTGLDDNPRVVPMWFEWTGHELVMTSLAGASKATALRDHPDVAVTIDAEGFPCDVLLLRGRVVVTDVDGIVPEYARAARRYLGHEAAAAFLARLDHPDTRMHRMTLRPTWVGVLDFKTRFPRVLGGVLGGTQDDAPTSTD